MSDAKNSEGGGDDLDFNIFSAPIPETPGGSEGRRGPIGPQRAAGLDNPRRFPCPTCKEPDCLTQEDRARGYQCDECAERSEGRPY